MNVCHACKHEIEIDQDIPVSRHDTCPNCLADLHCCLNCRFHDPGRQNECMEQFTVWVRDREASNPCHEFRFQDSDEVDDLEVMDAKRRLENMFKGLK